MHTSRPVNCIQAGPFDVGEIPDYAQFNLIIPGGKNQVYQIIPDKYIKLDLEVRPVFHKLGLPHNIEMNKVKGYRLP